MTSTPFFFLLGIILFLTWFTKEVLSEYSTDVLKGSSVVLSPDDAETLITSITWKHGADLAADWFGGNPTFYRIFNDLCSLNTKTGELTINDVRPEHGGVYTPEINGKLLSAQKLQVLSPVPKPRITPDCNPEKTKCTLTCSFDSTDDLGDVEIFWILDDRREKGTELQITKETKEETFICSLKNPVSSENSTELKNPLFSDKVVNALKGSTVVLSPHLDKAEIISIKWKHGADLAADWIGRDVPFYRSFKDLCSLNTKTGELMINDVRPEHGGEYTPEINGQILSAQKLRVLSPVPKPRITHDCKPEKTKCTLACSFDRTDDLVDVEVFWILDDRREKGTELQITKDTKEETFICSLKNPVSSENSTELKNPLFSGRRGLHARIPLVLSAVLAVTLVALLVFCRGWTVRRDKCSWVKSILKKICDTRAVKERCWIKKILKERNDTRLSEERSWIKRISKERNDTMLSEDEDQTLSDVDRMILGILKERNEIKLSEECKLMLLTVRSMILRILKEGTKVKQCLENVKKMVKKFFKGRNETKQNEDGEQTLREVDQMISRLITERKDKTAIPEELSLLNEEMKLTLVKTSNATVEFESETGTGTDIKLKDLSTDLPEEAIHKFETQRLQNDSPAGGDADQPEESTSLLETAECNQTSNVTVRVEINPQTDPETNREAEDQNTDPPEEDHHETDSGSAENDLPEAERPEDSSGSPDGTVSTSEPY